MDGGLTLNVPGSSLVCGKQTQCCLRKVTYTIGNHIEETALAMLYLHHTLMSLVLKKLRARAASPVTALTL